MRDITPTPMDAPYAGITGYNIVYLSKMRFRLAQEVHSQRFPLEISSKLIDDNIATVTYEGSMEIFSLK